MEPPARREVIDPGARRQAQDEAGDRAAAEPFLGAP